MININKNNGVATLTLNNAAKHNAFDDSVIEMLTTAFKEIDQDLNIRVMVIAAEGKSFSAGANLAWMQRMAAYQYAENLADARKLALMLNTLNNMRTATIAKVQGAAFGGAVGLISCCDIAVASDQATFCLSEVKIGLIPATISPYVIRAMGQRAARRYFLTAERFDAKVAQATGLISEVCQASELDTTVQDFINTLLENSPQAVHQAKKLISDVANSPLSDELIEDTCERIAKIRISTEGQEGLNAFLEKRKPNWTGSLSAEGSSLAEGSDNV